MKKTISILFCLWLAISAYAQDWSPSVYTEGTMYPGYIIKTDGTKIEGYIKARPRAELEGFGKSNQVGVDFFTDPNNKKTKTTYKPEDLKEYKIADKVYRSIHYSNSFSAKPLRFVLLVKDGYIAQYVWYDQDGYDQRMIPKYTSKDIIQKGDEKPFELSYFLLSFSKKMPALVSEDAELAQKVTNKEKGYGLTSYEKIIDEYNDWYAKNNPQK